MICRYEVAPADTGELRSCACVCVCVCARARACVCDNAGIAGLPDSARDFNKAQGAEPSHLEAPRTCLLFASLSCSYSHRS